ncbi:MAG: regulatory protein RecX [Gemmatimonadaceae bacterium]
MPDDTAHTVSSIAEHPKRRGRFVVSVGDGPVATVTAECIAELKLRVGSTLAEGVLDALRVHDRRTAVLDRALRLLALRGRSTSELTRALQRRRPDAPLPEDVQWAIRTLTERGYVDDARFAEQFVHDRAATRGWAKQRLRQELRRRGVSGAHAERALSQGTDDPPIDDGRAALSVVRKWRRTHPPRGDPERDRQRLYAFLARRGFSPSVIRVAMRATTEGDSEAP